jgi:hypothetical protein
MDARDLSLRVVKAVVYRAGFSPAAGFLPAFFFTAMYNFLFGRLFFLLSPDYREICA